MKPVVPVHLVKKVVVPKHFGMKAETTVIPVILVIALPLKYFGMKAVIAVILGAVMPEI